MTYSFIKLSISISTAATTMIKLKDEKVELEEEDELIYQEELE